ncbi:hypothetical protein M409DRAFT_28745 [Zasmidium cellare ATCC 36951]|uniref:N-acetyltransferase domain-containing protein n=1 Tax=Zasmidium cellare ATCC 36951 TaxID=1080233 RepID=A0A6A6C1N6_ZASCE|nr:uncharacterized protein M409DRAFT_28745 [Zasmidium cellare ATCC 36951]KAF2160865.1 hypothetical protein M409DRAFT_28745 [Zasmidium cellare ATCC 36951]
MTLTKELPTVLHTPRLTLRLADPDNPSDCQKIIQIYNDPHSSIGGNARVGINTPADVHAKHAKHGPRQEFCTKAVAPRGLFHLTFLKTSEDDGGEGELIGFIGLSFRPEMPYPDLGFALFKPFQGQGYASEAGRRALSFWTDDVGVKEIFCGALEGNERSLATAKRIGFVEVGGFDVEFGEVGSGEVVRKRAVAVVLPGMRWREFDEGGRRVVIRPTVGVETEGQRRGEIRVS